MVGLEMLGGSLDSQMTCPYMREDDGPFSISIRDLSLWSIGRAPRQLDAIRVELGWDWEFGHTSTWGWRGERLRALIHITLELWDRCKISPIAGMLSIDV
eukprot:1331349-Amorphochlora_amoeboformis.AAC.1